MLLEVWWWIMKAEKRPFYFCFFLPRKCSVGLSALVVGFRNTVVLNKKRIFTSIAVGAYHPFLCFELARVKINSIKLANNRSYVIQMSIASTFSWLGQYSYYYADSGLLKFSYLLAYLLTHCFETLSASRVGSPNLAITMTSTLPLCLLLTLGHGETFWSTGLRFVTSTHTLLQTATIVC